MAPTPEPRCVLVGVDGSPNSIAALRRAAVETVRRHAMLDIVCVVPDALDHGQAEAARGRLNDMVVSVLGDETRFPIRQRMVSGEAGDVLPELATHSELLVIGARVNSEHGAPLSGDIVPDVLRHSPCEVVICAGQPGQSMSTS